MGSEDFSQFGLAGVTAVLHTSAPSTRRSSKIRTRPACRFRAHSPLWAPVREPTIKAAIGAKRQY
jgi:hypothetical protein